MTKAKFDEVYDDLDNCYVDAHEVIKKKLDKIDYHKDYLFCPECHSPRMTVNAGPKMRNISKHKNEPHLLDCSYTFDTITKKDLINYKRSKTPNEINQDLQGFINIIIAVRCKDPDTKNIIKKTKSRTVYKKVTGSTTVKKRIPQQKLNNNLAFNYDADVEKYYYGEVYAVDATVYTDSTGKKIDPSFFNYKIYTVDKTLLFTISLSKDKSDPSLKKMLDSLIDNLREIAFLGKIVTQYNYKNVYLFNKNYLLINS